jgi:hypothetical protein
LVAGQARAIISEIGGFTMPRPFRARATAAVLALVAAGCQNYNFNPVGHCLIQPGTQRFTLSNVSSADILFVVDDSGSMGGKQARLASAFDDFVTNLTSTNVGRAQAGLLPIDFHIATTTTSVFFNPEPLSNQTCRSDCPGATGQLVCCGGTGPAYGPKPCQANADCPIAGTACRNTCTGLKGEGYCCAADGTFPPNSINQVGGAIVRCSLAGQPCGALETHYDFAGCTTPGVALDQLPFPDGAFVGSTNVASAVANPRVLHFDKRLYLSADGKNAQGFTKDQLKTFFVQNIAVGTCGSAQEQGFVAAKDALVKAFAGGQLDTYLYDRAAGQSATGPISTVPKFVVQPGGIPVAQAAASWPGPDSKLVLVWVGDEDDCSSPKDPSAGVMLLNTDQSGADACVRDSTTPAPVGGKEFGVSSFVDYFTSLGRKLGAAFVVSARSTTGDPTNCSNDTCVANATVGNCCDQTSALCQTSTCPPKVGDVCGGQAPGTRFLEAYSALRDKGADVVAGSVCGDFRPILDSVADIVKPPQTLSLPSQPAEERITILRIGTSNETRKICGRPLAPKQPNYDLTAAQATGADWWFTKSDDPGPPWDANGTATVAVPTRFVYINPNGNCKANPGETYSADYLGVVPPEGCAIDRSGPGTDPLGALDCQAKLGGQPQDWECFIPPGLTTGTCTCQSGG